MNCFSRSIHFNIKGPTSYKTTIGKSMRSAIFIKNIVSIWSSIALKITVIKGSWSIIFSTDCSTSIVCFIVCEPAIISYEWSIWFIKKDCSSPTKTSKSVLTSFIAIKYTVVKGHRSMYNPNSTTITS